MDLSVIIVNYNGQAWLEGCLTSLAEQAAGLDYEVIVVDNASPDGSAAMVERFMPEARLVLNPQNVGFAQANNQAIAMAQGRNLLLLNNDTLFRCGLQDMLAFLDRCPACGALGPRMLDGQGQPRGSWGYFPTLGRLTATMLLIDRLPFIHARFHPLLVRPARPEFGGPARAVDWASGACLLVRREALERVGLLDVNYFMYNEDLDWCYRARQAGYQVWVLPEAQLIHYGAGGQEWNNWKGQSATLNAYRSFITFYRKYCPAWQGLVLRVALAAGAGLRMLGGCVFYGLARNDLARRQARQVITTYFQALCLAAHSGVNR